MSSVWEFFVSHRRIFNQLQYMQLLQKLLQNLTECTIYVSIFYSETATFKKTKRQSENITYKVTNIKDHKLI